MNVREKLVELLAKYFDIGDSYCYNLTRTKNAFAYGTMGFNDFEEFDDETVDEIASHLIAHGVTFKDVPDTNVGEWISVKDRLPEENTEVLIYCKTNRGKEVFFVDKIRYFRGLPIWQVWREKVTHWMPLPKPPKGE